MLIQPGTLALPASIPDRYTIPTKDLKLFLSSRYGVTTDTSNRVTSWSDVRNKTNICLTQIRTEKPIRSNNLITFDNTALKSLCSNSSVVGDGSIHIFSVASFVNAKRHILIRKSANVVTTNVSTFEWMFGIRSSGTGSSTDMRPEFNILNNSNTNFIFTGTEAVPTSQLILMEVSLTLTGQMEYRQNGVLKGTATLIPIPSGKSNTNIILIGGIGTEGSDGQSRWLNGSIGSTIIYSSVKSNTEVNLVYNYYRSLYGLTITDRS